MSTHRPVHHIRAGIAIVVHQLRLEQRLSQEALAQRAGVSVSTLRRVEHVRTPLRIDTLTMLADGLGVPVARLLSPASRRPQ